MFYERPPRLYRALYPKALWRMPLPGEKTVYLTFDDGPIPEVTPWVLKTLREKEVKATFFMVGDNVRRHPEVFQKVIEEGHAVGNHTFHHLQGLFTSRDAYLRDVMLADSLISSPLFRPPHGHMREMQYLALARSFECVMWDVVTRDYNASLTPDYVLGVVQRLVRDGSIVVFHDSLKAWKNMCYAMPRAIDWLKEEGYTFKTIPEGLGLTSPIETELAV